MSAGSVTLYVSVAVLLIALTCLGAMALRRHQLRRTLGTFDAALKVGESRWIRGIFRYVDHRLEFLRLFSITPIPLYRWDRAKLELAGWEDGKSVKGVATPAGWIVLDMNTESGPVRIALAYGAYTGLSAWLEAGPVAGMGTWRQSPSN